MQVRVVREAHAQPELMLNTILQNIDSIPVHCEPGQPFQEGGITHPKPSSDILKPEDSDQVDKQFL